MNPANLKIRGKTLSQNATALPRQSLKAYGVSLSAAAIYRTAAKLDELQKEGGFILLAEAESDRKAKFTIEIGGEDTATGARTKKNIVIFAVDGSEITGCSVLLNADNYADTGEARNVDVVITRTVDTRPEYEKFLGRLNPLLSANKVSLREVAASPDQIRFVSRELEEDESNIRAAAQAEELKAESRGREALSHELLYGIGRQGIPLMWASLSRKKDAELRSAIQKAVDAKMIGAHEEAEVAAFLKKLHERAVQWILNHKPEQREPLDTILSYASLNRKQRRAFVSAVRSFQGDYADFWKTYLPEDPAFRGKPELIKALLLTQQLATLTAHHAPLIKELQVTRKISQASDLLKIRTEDWIAILKATGTPPMPGEDDGEKRQSFAASIQNLLHSTYPTQTVALMAKNGELPLKDANIRDGVAKFLSETTSFNITSSRVHDFLEQIKESSPDHHEQVTAELLRIQRVFQVSPSPQVMAKLMEKQLNSAYTIASFAEETFIKMYGEALGGIEAASAVYQRASYINTRIEYIAGGILPYSKEQQQPGSVMPPEEKQAAQQLLSKDQYLPNYADLFGRPDLCECRHCRSVYSPAAYFVDLMRFLWRGRPNSLQKPPLYIFKERRPDLFHMPLTCENTNTLIPYIDVANEVMEYYTANGKLDQDAARDTGDATAEELRASPQHVEMEAYKILAAAKQAPDGTSAVYPFQLPYHQPLDVIRTYTKQLGATRHAIMAALQNDFSEPAKRAIEAESLELSPEEYLILTQKAYNDAPDARQLHEYFGYSDEGELEKLKSVPEFLSRSGIKYTDLIGLVRTRFVNPHQRTLTFLQAVFAESGLSAEEFYEYLGKIKGGTISNAEQAIIESALDAYNTAVKADLDFQDFASWVGSHFDEFLSVVTLYQSASSCDLSATELRTVESVYSGNSATGITIWSKMHRFLRLWRKLGWTIEELDLALHALGEDDITPQAIRKLSSFVALHAQTKRPINLLATLFGEIDTLGKRPLYKRLFLNRAVQRIDDTIFKPGQYGNYLINSSETLIDHMPAIRAAFGISDDYLTAILETATVIENGVDRPIDPHTDTLSLGILSTLYRYVVLSKALKLRVPDFCLLIKVLEAQPFSRWDMDQNRFIEISPENTLAFYECALAAKSAGFKPDTLQYVFSVTTAPGSKLGVDTSKARLVARAVREAFSAIELEHSDEPPLPVTPETVRDKLSLTFQADEVQQILAVLDGTALFQAVSDANLAVVLPSELVQKYTYVKVTGLLTCTGIMSEAEQATLKALPGADASFDNAVDALYKMPEDLLSGPYKGIFDDLSEAYAKLLNRPEQLKPSSLEERLCFVYTKYLPLLKDRLRKDAVVSHIAALVGLTDEAASVLIRDDIESLVGSLALYGHSATYFSDAAFNTNVLQRIDRTIDFDWAEAAPYPVVPADGFSVQWESWVVPPASGEYTLIVEVAQQDESFALYLDNVLVLQKSAGDPMLSWEAAARLNASSMHHLRLDYAETLSNAKIRLSWRTATTAAEAIPASAVYPAQTIEQDFVAKMQLYHRAAKAISGFGLDERELEHICEFGKDFGDLTFKPLTAAQWQRLCDYVALRKAVPQAQATLVDLFAEANKNTASLSALKQLLQQATTWDQKNLDYLADSHFSLTIDSFKNEIELKRLLAAMKLMTKTGVPATRLAVWAAPETTDFGDLEKIAQDTKNTVKAKYEETDWYEVAGSLSDNIREHQKQALIAHLLTRPEIINHGISDADGLFEYFLIDVQMGACMDSSRIVLANSALQLFVARCLLNLESDTTSGSETGVSPEDLNTQRWEWMKNYRVWEANRKVFLYPENWLEPEWRDNKSEFFKELESELTQNDITDKSSETAFRNYLSKLSRVANLDVCGMYQDTAMDYDYEQKTEITHVFARTRNNPHQYYYRTWNQKYQEWSAWGKVPLEIRGVDDGDDSGIHLIPVVWKKRLFLFWPEFIEKQEESPGAQNTTPEGAWKEPVGLLKPTKYWEVRLSWSEYADGKWFPKQMTNKYVILMPPSQWIKLREVTFKVLVEPYVPNHLLVTLYEFYEDLRYEHGKFRLKDIAGEPWASVGASATHLENEAVDYEDNFMLRSSEGQLSIGDKLLLEAPWRKYKVLFSSQISMPVHMLLEPGMEHPFFYIDIDTEAQRTYFVRPAWISKPKIMASPEVIEPVIIESVAADTIGNAETSVSPAPFGYFGMSGNARLRPGRFASWAGVPTGITPIAVRNIGRVSLPSYGSTAAYHAIKANNTLAAKGDMAAAETIPMAFAGSLALQKVRPTGVEFHTFHHPYASIFATNLNELGLDGLMQSDTGLPDENGDPVIPDDDGVTFEEAYDPTWRVAKPGSAGSTDARTYYKENVCFDPYGVNSIYNWELFFHAPLYIATRLSKNGRFAEAMSWFHYIFDPRTDKDSATGRARYWQVPPFKKEEPKRLEELFLGLNPNSNRNNEHIDIAKWRDNPFRPHVVARNRPIAYMKHVVIKYIENLIAWGDQLFRRDTWESINEALQIYVMASHILGPRPEFVPERNKIKAETYASLEPLLDDFSNAIVQLENLFPYSSEVPQSTSGYSGNLLGAGLGLYFCIPNNETLIEYWDTIADRLYKIRHCMNIDGVERRLALFEPPIDPGMLVKAVAQGLSLGSILSDLSTPPPIYRHSYLLQKANEFCAEVKSLGSALLSILEKKDGEELSRMRAAHETAMLELMSAVKDRQVLEAKANQESLEKSRDAVEIRLQHYLGLIGESRDVSDTPAIADELTAESLLPDDISIDEVKLDVDDSLVESEEAGVKLLAKEKTEMDKLEEAHTHEDNAAYTEFGTNAILALIPEISAEASPFGVGTDVCWGGSNLSHAGSAVARFFQMQASNDSLYAEKSAKFASYIRREQDWNLQANTAAKDIIQLDRQIIAAQIRVQVAEKELENHNKQIENAKEVEDFLKDKFTNQELYQWMKEQTFAIYKQSYNMAYDLAKKAEKAYCYELGDNMAGFIQYGYWDNSYQGLMAGERLQLALRQMEKSFIEDNKRELELTKNVSLALWSPLALQQLKETGSCYVTLPEELFDLDFQGHYFRRIKSVRLSVPCVAGPYATLGCTLRLLKNKVRIKTSMNLEGQYEHNNDEGVWTDDGRFRSSNVIVKSMATSTGQNDAGLFELNFRDERYLPFEGAGVISEWKVELTQDANLRQFDYSTITDVVLHISYTAREDAGLFKTKCIEYLTNYLKNANDLSTQPLVRLFSLKHEFPTEWHRFLHPAATGADQVLTLTIGKDRMPWFAQHREIIIMRIDLLAKTVLGSEDTSEYTALLSARDSGNSELASGEISMPKNIKFGNIRMASLQSGSASIDIESIDIEKPLSLKLKQSSATYYASLPADPEEVEDLMLVLHYKLCTAQ